jgi:hypothetical protein
VKHRDAVYPGEVRYSRHGDITLTPLLELVRELFSLS